MAVLLRPGKEEDDGGGLLRFGGADGGDDAFEVVLVQGE